MKEDTKRIRINAKQSTKGLWTFDATVELPEIELKKVNEKDAGDISTESIGKILLDVIKDTQRQFKEDGKEII